MSDNAGPKVFVTVPSYGHARYVEECLRSIFRQSLRPSKLLVIDDGSPDDSPAVIERVLAGCPFESELIVRENRGLAATLEQALSLSGGEYFAYLGSDDIWLPHMLREQTELLEARPDAALAYAHVYVIDENDNIVDRTDNWFPIPSNGILDDLLGGRIFSSPGVVYRRDILARYGWNTGSKLEDYELYLKLAADHELAGNPRVLAAWRRHGANTSDDVEAMLGEWIAAQDRAAAALGLGRDELDRIQGRLRFDTAAEFVRQGERRKAAELAIENWRHAGSARALLATAARLAAPPSLFRWNRQRKKTAAAGKYGDLKDLLA
ncbi:MAG: glycosyltransferase family 2 protein [Acidobacteria bacterium]|nr:glycosyltransferase family 2 protein [Acidobacteriota bacterium]MCW5948014.1 glycosyltransferase family 2 protein [Pyrinomonadaceae bacterium]